MPPATHVILCIARYNLPLKSTPFEHYWQQQKIQFVAEMRIFSSPQQVESQ